LAFIAPIVEGHGETEALPALLHRMAQLARPGVDLRVNPPIRIKLGSFMNDNAYLNQYVSLAAAKAAQYGGWVLILLDCDDACPAELGPAILARARAARADVPHLVVLAHREFETWFIAAAASLRGRFGLPDDLLRPEGFETIRGAKGWLDRHTPDGYDPVTHQAKFARAFDLVQAQDPRSFRRFLDRLSGLLEPQP